MRVVEREREEQFVREFADRHGLARARPGPEFSYCGSLEGVRLSITKVKRGSGENPHWATEFLAAGPSPFPGGMVAYRPNFLWRLPGPRRVSDNIGRWGLLGFAHHDGLNDADLDKLLVFHAQDVGEARGRITRTDCKQAILSALRLVGHIRIQESCVALDRPDRRKGTLRLLDSLQEVEQLAFAAIRVARSLATP